MIRSIADRVGRLGNAKIQAVTSNVQAFNNGQS